MRSSMLRPHRAHATQVWARMKVDLVGAMVVERRTRDSRCKAQGDSSRRILLPASYCRDNGGEVEGHLCLLYALNSALTDDQDMPCQTCMCTNNPTVTALVSAPAPGMHLPATSGRRV